MQDLVYQRYVYVKNVEKVGKLHVQNLKKKLNTQIHPFLGKQIIRSFHGPLEWFASPMLWRRMVSSIHGYLDCDEGSLGLRICATRIPGLENSSVKVGKGWKRAQNISIISQCVVWRCLYFFLYIQNEYQTLVAV